MAEFLSSRGGWTVMVRPELRDPLVAALATRPARSQMLRGASGIGKTTLAAQVGEELTRLDMTVVPVVALEELSEVPLAALAPLLNASAVADASDDVAGRVQRLIGLIGGAPDRYVLVVDDAPLLDALSASVVYQLVRVYGVPTLLTARDEHRLVGPIARMLHEDLVTVTDLEPLDAAQLEELVEHHLAGSVRPESVVGLLRATAGNPLLLRELVLTAQRAGRVHEGPFGVEVEAAALPVHLVDSVRHRVTELDAEELGFVRLLALAQPWPADLVGTEDAEVLSSLRSRGLVDDGAGVGIRLTHPLLTEAVIALMSSSERAERAATAAAALRTTGRDTDRFAAVRLARVHSSVEREGSERGPDAGQVEVDGGSTLSAADLEWAAGYAASVGDAATSLSFSHAAAEAGGGFRAHVLAAAAHSVLGETDSADEQFDRAARTAQTDAERALLALRWGQHLAYRRADPVAALERATTLRAPLSADASVALDAEMVKWRLMAGVPLDAAVSTLPRLAPPPGSTDDDSADRDVDVLGRLSMGLTSAMIAAMRGDAEAARGAVAEARPLADLVSHDQPYAGELLNLSQMLSELADASIADARALAERQRVSGTPDAAGQWSYVLALIELHAGRLDRAGPLADLAVRQLAWRDFTGLSGAAIALGATAAAMSGDAGAAQALLATVDDAAHADIKVILQRAEASAWLAIPEGRAQEAAAPLTDAVAAAVQYGHHLLAALTASTAIRLGIAEAVAETLAAAATETPSRFVRLVADAATVASAKDADAAMRLVPALRSAGLDALARTFSEDAARSASASAEARRQARHVAAELASVTVREPALTRDREIDGAVLSARELQVARGAAARERSREIAVRLGISERTVNNHLANVYRKLGVASRDELAAVLRDA